MMAASPASQERNDAQVIAFAKELGLSLTIATWLWQQGHTRPENLRRFFAPKLAELTAPDAMVDRLKAAQRLALAVKRREPICVYGDYDCDGIT
ncbi:MAG TPA: single-stranded-DNA-specific exonuclease RecJ, partial [Polyangiaceae bacterium]|nr:single-stranded-DNA-specific exonuclease RecJ [Polyangiaceae bacterium]